MRDRIARTIAWGRGCVANVVVPPANYPRAVPKSDKSLPGADGVSPGYRGGMVYHYISVLGYDPSDDTCLIVDPGFQPSTYWVTTSQLASMVTPHGIVWASGAPELAAPPPAPPATVSDAELLAKAMGNALPLQRYAELLPTMQECLRLAQCTTENRVAFLLAQVSHESCGLLYQEEIADGSAYNNRPDLGNGPTDGPRYKGRGWIQLTGAVNYRAFSQWAFEQGIVATPDHFVDNPTEVGEDRYAGLSTAWYWTVARPGMNALCDANDFIGVTKAVNGGTNGLADREARLVVCREVAAQWPAIHDAAPAPAPAQPVTPLKPGPVLVGRNGPNPRTAETVEAMAGAAAHEVTMWLPGRRLTDEELSDLLADPQRLDTTLGHAINAASLARINYQLLAKIAARLGVDHGEIA